MNALSFYRIARWLHLHHIPFLPKCIQALIFLIFNAYVPYTADIGKHTRLGYGGMGVVIHARAKIGTHCLILQQVTIGGRSKQYEVPCIGNYVYIGTGAKVLGNVEIGNHVAIGANAVVLKSIPEHCAAAGVPAKIIKTGVSMSDYI
ncbi:MAG: serine acetyltransferase [Hyphomonadaceae bacterium]|nr:serine acetyltransferase [Clostridia bacterium]